MPELVTLNEQQLDNDAINILRLLHADGDTTTSEAKSRLAHKNNDFTRRRFEWLENAGLVELSTEPWSQNKSINVTVAAITDEGREFLQSWNFEGMGDGLPVEERVRRLEDRVESLEEANAGLREDLAEEKRRRDALKNGFTAIQRYLEEAVNVDLREFSPAGE